MVGKSLGQYQISGQLGSGGMGEVYLATDTNLKREVAIKLLPAELATDPRRLARMEREAHLLAALNHPNIAAIHNLERLEDTQFLVLELVEGQTLEEWIEQKRGKIKVEEALELACQVAEALEAAHGQGVIHRDLKPANIKVKPDGKVKVLDFGLAKAFEVAEQVALEGIETASNLSHTPTLTMKGTREGAILGTVAYMSPEQARGHPLDKRTDIWSFGCVLFEMLTGNNAFASGTASDTIAAILRGDPDWGALPGNTPTKIRDLVVRCLQKDPRRRLRDIGDAWVEIDDVLRQPETAAAAVGEAGPVTDAAPRAPGWRRAALWSLAIVAAVTMGAFVGRWANREEASRRPAQPIHTVIPLPDGTVLEGWASPVVALSPDGKKLAFVATRDGVQQLYIRHLDRDEVILVASSEDAEGPFFSPDSEWVGFAVGVSGLSSQPSELRKVRVDGGLAQTIAGIGDYFGAAWHEDSTIFFVDASTRGLSRVPADGGAPEIVPVSLADNESASRLLHWPQILPGGDTLIAAAGEGPRGKRIVRVDLETGVAASLPVMATFARYSTTGHLLYTRADASLHAAPFDPQRGEVTGPSVRVLEDVTLSGNAAAVLAFSTTGSLVYTTGYLRRSGRELNRLAWVDRSGEFSYLPVEPDTIRAIDVSPDGTRLAASTWNGDLWVYDLSRNTRVKLPAGSTLFRDGPRWTLDGERIAFIAEADGFGHLFWQSADGSGEPELLLRSKGEYWPGSWTPDGRTLALHSFSPGVSEARWMIRLLNMDDIEAGVEAEAQRIGSTPTRAMWPAISPDGQWLAFSSDETGQSEIYVQSFPGPGNKVGVSTEGGDRPRWSVGGTELFYWAGDRTMVVPVATEPDFRAGTPQLVFGGTDLRDYDVAPDGRLLVAERIPDSGIQTELRLVVNWFESLKQMVSPEQ